MLLKIVVFIKLCGVRTLGKLRALCTLCLDEVCKKLLGEYAACGEVIVVLFKSIESLGKRGGKSGKLCLFLFGKMEEVEIVWAPTVCMGIDLVLYAVKTCHKDSGIAEIGVARSVGIAELKAALRGSFRVCRDTDNGAAVGGCVANGNGCFKAGNEALEGVCAGVGQCAKGSDVL